MPKNITIILNMDDRDIFAKYIDETCPLDSTEILSENDLDTKIGQLVSWIREANYSVFYTGAGVSTSAGLPDYRGPNGVWTKRKNGDESWRLDQAKIYDPTIRPSRVHTIMAELVAKGFVKSVISTNIDGLHVASGLRRYDNLIEMHGNKYVEECRFCSAKLNKNDTESNEECRSCGFENYRTIPVPNFSDRSHQTENRCPHCHSVLYNNIVHFGETYLDVPSYEKSFDHAFREVCRADLIVVWGSSLTVPSACDLVDTVVERGHRLVIINQQKTPKDNMASLILHADCERVITGIRRELLG